MEIENKLTQRSLNFTRCIGFTKPQSIFRASSTNSSVFASGLRQDARKCPPWQLCTSRGAVFWSKKGKRKTVKAVAKRFKRLPCGRLLRWRAGKNHNMRKKSCNQRRRLRKPVIVKGRQLRKLNRMISGW